MSQSEHSVVSTRRSHGRRRSRIEELVGYEIGCLAVFIVGAAACASIGEFNAETAPEDPAVVQSPVDAGVDVPVDAAPCSDCEYFPDDCSLDVLCPNGPFGANTIGGDLDPRWTINVIRGRSSSDLWAAGALGALAHFDGTSWTRSDVGSRNTLRALWLNDSGEVAVSSFLYVYTRGLDVADAGAPSPGGWTSIRPSFDAAEERYADGQVSLVSAWGAPGAEWFWYAAASKLNGMVGGLWRMRRSPTTVFEVRSAVPGVACGKEPCSVLNSIHGASAHELWAVGESGSAVLVSNAEGDAPVVKGSNTQTRNALNGVWVASASDAWAVGAVGTVRHNTGDASIWQPVRDVPTNEDLRAIWGASSSDIWAVGNAGVVLHYDGTTWSRVKIAGLGMNRPDFTTVWVSGPGRVWVGGEGVVLSLGGKP